MDSLMAFLNQAQKLLWALTHPQYWKFGDAVHRDFLARLRIEGKVVDAGSGQALSSPTVFFLDTGLDDIRSRDPEKWTLPVGRGDASGAIALDFDYTWGSRVVADEAPGGKFQIRVQHFGYGLHSADFTMSQLAKEGDRLIVPLYTVKLARRSSSSGGAAASPAIH
jgi:hypothetical protein